MFLCFRDDTQVFGQHHGLLTVGILRLQAGVGVGKILPTLALIPTPGRMVDSGRLHSSFNPDLQPWFIGQLFVKNSQNGLKTLFAQPKWEKFINVTFLFHFR